MTLTRIVSPDGQASSGNRGGLPLQEDWTGGHERTPLGYDEEYRRFPEDRL